MKEYRGPYPQGNTTDLQGDSKPAHIKSSEASGHGHYEGDERMPHPFKDSFHGPMDESCEGMNKDDKPEGRGLFPDRK